MQIYKHSFERICFLQRHFSLPS